MNAEDVWNAHALRSARIHFGPTVASPLTARTFLESTARGWGLGDVGEVARLLVSEVVTNAVQHGTSGGTVEVTALPSGLRVEVSDSNPTVPAPSRPAPTDTTGRGLMIVEKLATRWGVEPTRTGKVVWFEVDDSGDAGPSGSNRSSRSSV